MITIFERLLSSFKWFTITVEAVSDSQRSLQYLLYHFTSDSSWSVNVPKCLQVNHSIMVTKVLYIIIPIFERLLSSFNWFTIIVESVSDFQSSLKYLHTIFERPSSNSNRLKITVEPVSDFQFSLKYLDKIFEWPSSNTNWLRIIMESVSVFHRS